MRVTGFAIVVAATFAALIWTGWLAWGTADQIATRLSEEKLQDLRLGDTFAADLHELRSHFRRYEANRNEDHWRRFGHALARLEASLENQLLTAISQGEKHAIRNLKMNLSEYASASKHAHDLIQGGTPREQLASDIINLGDQASEMAADIRSLLAARQFALERSMEAARARLKWLVRLVAGTLVVTVMLAAALAVLVWKGLVNPLKRRLSASEDLARRSERLASLGILAAGVAHEIRNPLTAIKARLYLQQRRLPPDAPAIEDARMIDGEINRLEEIVRSVLDFAKPSNPTPVTINPVRTLDHVRTLLAPECERHGTKIDVNGSLELRIRADATQFQQVVLNLARNAVDAAGDDGRVHLRVRKALRSFGGIAVPSAFIEVEDSGPGLTEEARARIFDPFFTTKSKGTGLGLAISARIVESNGGALEFASHPSQGTTFRVVFPCEA